jgi:hypothetical protein
VRLDVGSSTSMSKEIKVIISDVLSIDPAFAELFELLSGFAKFAFRRESVIIG